MPDIAARATAGAAAPAAPAIAAPAPSSAPAPAAGSASTPGRIVVFGDVIDDIVVAPTEAIRPDTDTGASIVHRAGGSAANTAAWLGTRGAGVDFIGVVGRRDVDRHFTLLAQAGVIPRLTSHPELPTGTIVILVDGDRRSMLTDRGANAVLHPDAVTDGLLDAAAILHLSGYSVIHTPDPAALGHLFDRAAARDVVVSVDPGSAGYIADFGSDAFLRAVTRADVVFPNLDEGAALTGLTDPRVIAETLAERIPLVALTTGIDGVVVAGRGIETMRVDVSPCGADATGPVDPTGAGDAFSAGFLHEWNRTRDPRAAAEAGVQLAGRAVTVVGGRPPA